MNRDRAELDMAELVVLARLEDMGVLWEPELGVLLAELGGRVEPIRPALLRATLRRWKSRGLIRTGKTHPGEPRLVWLTATGARVTGTDDEPWHEPDPASRRHTAEVARARAWLERGGLADAGIPGPATGWTSARSWRQLHSRSSRAGAAPHGIAHTPHGRYAVVVVSRTERAGRALNVALRLTQEYRRVLYIVPTDAATATDVPGTTRPPACPGEVDILTLPPPRWSLHRGR